MEIPIQNIYYLLCYAWNKLEERDIVDITGIETTQLCDLFAKILIGGTSRLLKMGLDRGYIQQNVEVIGIKGKVDFGLSLKKNLFHKARAQCQFDELSHNVLHNQILKSTLRHLAEVNELEANLKEQLYGLYRILHEVEDIRLSKSLFRLIQLHRNNSFYEFLLKICELVADNLLPSEQKGHSKFKDFIRDERQMASLFEEFVRNFFRLEQNIYKVYREDIRWDISSGDESFLPKMQTDISLESKDRKIVIDTKYYQEALKEHYDKEKIKSENMYQIFAYLKNLESTKEINRYCEGILLYPTVTKDLDINITIHQHQVRFKTINLNQDWRVVHKDLLAIVGL
jgi:5-methylcytosine-specific restriction enzyme subunit McrC